MLIAEGEDEMRSIMERLEGYLQGEGRETDLNGPYFYESPSLLL